MIPGQFREYSQAGYHPAYEGAAKSAGWKRFGEFLKSGFADHKSSEWQARHKSIFEPVMKTVQGMNISAGEEGAFLVPPEFAPGILERVYSNEIFNKTDNYSVTGNGLIFTRNAETSRANGSRFGGIRGYWVGEGGAGTKSMPKVKQVALRFKKLFVLVYLTNELIQDAGPAAEQYVTRAAAAEFNFMLGDTIFNGNGVGMPLGIMNSGALLTITKESGQAATTIVSGNIDKMHARRIISGAKSYAWYHNQDCNPQLNRLAQDFGSGATANGVPLYRPDQSIAGAAPQSLLGIPRVETEFQQTLGTTGDILLADLGHVISISKSSGISQEQSIHVEFLTDQNVIRFIMRVDARPWEDTAITPFKGSNTQSAFIVTETRS